MTVFLTILSGVSVYVLGQVIIAFVIEPIKEQRSTIGKIADALIFFANRYTNTGLEVPQPDKRREELEEVRILLRSLASELVVRTQSIPGYDVLSKMRIVRKINQIQSASGGLFFISNNLFTKGEGINNHKESEKVASALGIIMSIQG